MTYLAGADYFVRWIPFPPDNGTDGGAVVPNDDGTFTIYLDEKLLCQRHKAKETYAHEVAHIEGDDFYNGKPIREIERIYDKNKKAAPEDGSKITRMLSDGSTAFIFTDGNATEQDLRETIKIIELMQLEKD